MALRYKGIPDRGANKQADDLPPLCFCRFMGVGQPLDGWECDVHGLNKFGCDHCQCIDYRPNEVKKRPRHWPRCVCGHIAQQHNQVRT